MEAPERWWLPEAPGLGSRWPTVAAAVGALGVLVAAALEAGGDSEAHIQASVGSMLEPGATSLNEWLGFEQVRRGWVGIAVPSDWSADAVAELRGRGDLSAYTPVEAASRLQSMGIAAAPVRTGAVSVSSSVGVGEAGAPLLDGGSRLLEGLVVLDMGRVVAGPFAAESLEMLGATVVAVRPPGHRESWGGGEEVDARTPSGVARLADLMAGSDLVVENFRPRAWDQLIDRMGASIPQRRLALRGYPQSSPRRNWKIYGFLVEAAFGLGPAPIAGGERRVSAGSVPLWDRVAGVVGAASSVRLLTRRSQGVAEISQMRLASLVSRAWAAADG